MTANMKASNNTFENMGDKGISVGKWSEANITLCNKNKRYDTELVDAWLS